MNFFAIAGVSIQLSVILVSGIILFFGRKKLHRLLLFFFLAVILWGTGLYFIGNASNEAEAKLAWKVGLLGVFFLAPIFFHLSSVWCEIKRRYLLPFAYGQAIIFSVVSISSHLILNKFRLAFGAYFFTANYLYTFAVMLFL